MEIIIYKEDETIDARDLFPPLPLLSIKNRIDKLRANEVAKILINLLNYPEAESEVMVLAKSLGHRILEIERKEKEIIFFIKKGKRIRKQKYAGGKKGL